MNDQQSTFHGYNPESMERLPRCIGLHFPAILTRKLGLDTSIIDLMRPSLDAGMKVNAFRDMIAELHSKEHLRQAIAHEYEGHGTIARAPKLNELFSPFDNQEKYAGYVPSAKWFRNVYKKYHWTVRNHMDNDVKKLGLSVMFVDVSYKAAKKIRNINKQPVVNGIVTIMNECNEIRSQFFVPTDAHDQYKAPTTAMLQTMEQYGHTGPQYTYTDNPSNDAKEFLSIFPSLRAQQDKLDFEYSNNGNNKSTTNNSESDGNSNESDVNDATCTNYLNDDGNTVHNSFETWLAGNVTYLNKKDAIDLSAGMLLDGLEDNASTLVPSVMGLDAEWFVPTNSIGRPCGAPDKLGLIQLAVRQDDGIKVFIYHVRRLDTLPTNLRTLLEHDFVRFSGCQVSGDLRKINRDFRTTIDIAIAVNVFNMAATRGVVTNGRSLEAMAHCIIGVPMDKGLQTSNWNHYPLSHEQKHYAAKRCKV